MINLAILIIAILIGVYFGFTRTLKITGMIMAIDLGRHWGSLGSYQYKIRITIEGNDNLYELFVLDKPQILVKLVSRILFKHKIE